MAIDVSDECEWLVVVSGVLVFSWFLPVNAVREEVVHRELQKYV